MFCSWPVRPGIGTMNRPSPDSAGCGTVVVVVVVVDDVFAGSDGSVTGGGVVVVVVGDQTRCGSASGPTPRRVVMPSSRAFAVVNSGGRSTRGSSTIRASPSGVPSGASGAGSSPGSAAGSASGSFRATRSSNASRIAAPDDSAQHSSPSTWGTRYTSESSTVNDAGIGSVIVVPSSSRTSRTTASAFMARRAPRSPGRTSEVIQLRNNAGPAVIVAPGIDRSIRVSVSVRACSASNPTSASVTRGSMMPAASGIRRGSPSSCAACSIRAATRSASKP